MSEEVNKNQEAENLQNEAEKKSESTEKQELNRESTDQENKDQASEESKLESEAKSEDSSESSTLEAETTKKSSKIDSADANEQDSPSDAVADSDSTETSQPEPNQTTKNATDELDEANAEDSEDEDVSKRHEIELKDYDSMSLDELVIEIEKLLSNEKIQSIREHVTQIKIAFDKKFNEIIEEKKEAFIEEGGNIIDFQYTSPVKKKFNSIYFDYREKRDQYYNQLKKNLNQNLKERLSIIEELKNMIGAGESMNSTFQHFKDLQERWKNAGPIPKSEYRQVWENYHFHVERFYDFLHLDREFRDLDFKHNLDQKLKLISRAEELIKEDDINRAFRELQLLHKMWKEELGPVAREFREEIWEKFSHATQQIHDKRQAYFEELDKEREKNLAVKEEVIEEIRKIADQEVTSHNDAQTKIKNIEKLREIFFKAGKVPRKDMDEIWNAFKKHTRTFNRKKNAFYKNLKQDQFENLKKKLDLIEVAEEHKDSEDFETTTPLMKKIQDQWKEIGHVPRKDSDKIWKKFKNACNHYFNRLHSKKNEDLDEEFKAFLAKKDLINKVKSAQLPDNKDESLKTIEGFIEEWGEIGAVPRNKKYIEGKFNKTLDQLFKKTGVEKKEAELLKYESRLHDLDEGSERDINREVFFIRKKIDETKDNINQFENNLQFFSSTDDSNPLVKEVKDKIERYRDELSMWKTKLDKLNQL
ncbi:DUF349 domain-containing protein [Psychroflexus salis]|uniref:DUF349 domain-containing protein n=1 Tax=Psychroflexus salis TaxID=1526574 RepID=A0A917E9Y7_9FLAO|nr:DUF349 domain-containing protein [Psychroflexus salis]GGE15222.1 hypothetical protein GCM10010831_15700 [Psychroflexus salis]